MNSPHPEPSATRHRIRGGVLGVIGYVLSPLSWWNDAFVNIPIAYGLASLVALVSCRLFAPALIVGYWLTNIGGLMLMHKGARDVVGGDQPRPKGRIWVDIVVGTGYTVLIAAFAFTGILKPVHQFLNRNCPVPRPQTPVASTQSLVHFAREEITMNVRAGSVEVWGLYHFENSAANPVTAGIFYPFPLDSVHGYPDSIALPGFDFVPGDSGISFKVRFEPQAEDSFLAYYRQPLRGKQARYIVTTTRAWRRAIDQARFRITVPAGFQDVRLSYKPDAKEETDSMVIYSFARRGFYPNQDVVVTWR